MTPLTLLLSYLLILDDGEAFTTRNTASPILPIRQQQQQGFKSEAYKNRLFSKLSLFSSNSNTSTNIPNADDDDDDKVLKKGLRKDFLTIAVPAFIQLTAEPLASLVDTAYLGRLGPDVFGGAGVAISAQYAVSKLYNDPLLRTSISLVATQDGKSRSIGSSCSSDSDSDSDVQSDQERVDGMSVAVSSALLLALSVGLIQAIVYYLFASNIIGAMGVSSTSTMYHSAFSYLKIRALGTPAATLWLVTNGVFRGLGMY